MNRRRLLATTGLGLGSLSAGCLSRFTDASEGQLSEVTVLNSAPGPRTVSVRVHRGDELVHESTHELKGSDHAMVSATAVECWGEEPGEFVVAARLDGGDWTERNVTDGAEADCVEAHVSAERDGVTIARVDRCASSETGECDTETGQ
ncbi:hypothetical protein [Haloarcula laminariae]|uniref:hypothetical protein n=1 Tax=Haloarcula laminariae TaxID=2961577 RepID=UPI0024062D96|nr:hypothetical protein [Halomicroarcula sp. FL173]